MGRDKRETEQQTFRKPRASSVSVEVADWGSVDAQKLVRAIAIASKQGGALRLGYTRDGGAYAIGVYAGSNYFTDYIRPTEDIEDYLDELCKSFEEYDGSADKAPVKARAKRG